MDGDHADRKEQKSRETRRGHVTHMMMTWIADQSEKFDTIA